MIGFQNILVERDIRAEDLAKELGVSKSSVWSWIRKNKVPSKYLAILSSKFNVDKSYLNDVVNDIVTHVPQHEGIKDFKIIDDYIEFNLYNKKKEKFVCYVDLEDWERVKNHKYKWFAERNRNCIYVTSTIYNISSDGKNKPKRILLHRFILNYHGENKIDHINHNGLDNRKENLRCIENKNNITNRQGANKNNKTGVRNVNYIEQHDEYWVQIMKNGVRYRWEFPSDKFEEACEFAEIKRKEIFGEYAGLG